MSCSQSGTCWKLLAKVKGQSPGAQHATRLVKPVIDIFDCIKCTLGGPSCQIPPAAFAPSCYVTDSVAEGIQHLLGRHFDSPAILIKPKEACDHWSLQSLTRTSVPGLIHDLIGAWE